MLAWIREKFGPVIIGGIIGLIAFIFIVSGVFSPKATRGLHEGAVAGTVNGDPITISEFQRNLHQRIEFLKNMSGGRISEEGLKDPRVKQSVFQDLVVRKLMIQQAKEQGLVIPDEEIRDRIQEMPDFKKNGKFDVATYRQILEANSYTPAGFEKLIRDELTQEQWRDYFKDRSYVSEAEAKQEYLLDQDQRAIKYVLLTPDAVRKEVPVSSDEIKKFLADAPKKNTARMRYEEGKNTVYKGQTFEQAQDKIAHDMIASQKFEETAKLIEKLADQVTGSLMKDVASDKKINALLKKYEIEVKTTALLSRQDFYIPDLGQPIMLVKDAFNEKSPIDARTGGKAKKYPLSGRVLVALMIESKKPDLAKFEKDRENLIQQMTVRKSQDLFQNWARDVFSKAKVDPNPSVLSAGE